MAKNPGWVPSHCFPDRSRHKGAADTLIPLAQRGNVIGCPVALGSTHSLLFRRDNLASDNAVDLAVPYGTPVLAVASGTIGSLIGPLDSTDPHLAGLRLHPDTPGSASTTRTSRASTSCPVSTWTLASSSDPRAAPRACRTCSSLRT